MNILIVDDSLIMRRVIRGAVENYFEHVSVHEAENGQVAVDIVKTTPIDIIFLDWNMPIMDGEEALEAIRADHSFKNIRIIMATTEGTKDKVMKIIKKGASGYLVKPFQEAGIKAMLDKIVPRMKR
jgi:two-component system chemotaxis response regulator CheY